MKGLLLAAGVPIAALIFSPTSATAASAEGKAGSAASVTVHHGSVGRDRPDFRRGAFACQQHGRGFDSDRRHGRDFDGDCGFLDAGLGYLDPGDYDANRSFSPDLWNDWWHERPSRAYPRWVQQNQNCTPDRMWWSGSGWHC